MSRCVRYAYSITAFITVMAVNTMPLESSEYSKNNAIWLQLGGETIVGSVHYARVLLRPTPRQYLVISAGLGVPFELLGIRDASPLLPFYVRYWFGQKHRVGVGLGVLTGVITTPAVAAAYAYHPPFGCWSSRFGVSVIKIEEKVPVLPMIFIAVAREF